MRLPDHCPACGTELHTHDNVSGTRAPRDGDVMVCYTCRRPAVFDDGRLRPPTAVERLALEDDPRYRALLEELAGPLSPEVAVARTRRRLGTGAR